MVEAVVAKKNVDVAFVVVAFQPVKFWRVEDAETRKPPVSVERFVTVSDPRVPTLVRDELTTDEPRVVPERMEALLMR